MSQNITAEINWKEVIENFHKKSLTEKRKTIQEANEYLMSVM